MSLRLKSCDHQGQGYIDTFKRAIPCINVAEMHLMTPKIQKYSAHLFREFCGLNQKSLS